MQRLAVDTHTRRLARGQILFSQGEPTGHLFVVRSGRLRVLVSSAHGDDLVLTVLEPGETFGEVSVLSDEPRSASVDAIEASEVLAVPAEDVRAVLLENPAALLALVARLAATVRRVTDVAADLVFLDVPRRLAKLLITEAVVQPDGSTVCDLTMNQSGVAARLGATRQSLNRALGEFARRGWLTVDGTAVQLDDPDALRRFAGS
ncbi:MAG TPA: Crp/Fnr family transcriptional regulator [Jatrophihabitantaceae bacterium]|nr:Crp/Fnr family transcriptional regulator [Jatrophihabitantaceae bacterium]